MLVIFDIDGTICDTQEAEGVCYARAILEVTGISLETLDWSQYSEPTSSGIVRNLLEGDPDLIEKEARIERRFVELLSEAVAVYPQDFTPIDGVTKFINELREESDSTVAIATGGFALEARFKLQCCGLEIGDFPYSTSSDTTKRSEILQLAAERAGVPISSSVYFGDALWDIKVSQQLKIPLIGIGRRKHVFEENGMKHHFRDYKDREAIRSVLHRYKEESK